MTYNVSSGTLSLYTTTSVFYFSFISHVRASEIKLKQICFISVLFQFYFTCNIKLCIGVASIFVAGMHSIFSQMFMTFFSNCPQYTGCHRKLTTCIFPCP